MSDGTREPHADELAFLAERSRAARHQFDYRAANLRADDPETGPYIDELLAEDLKVLKDPPRGVEGRVRSALGPLLSEVVVLTELEEGLVARPLGDQVMHELQEARRREDELMRDRPDYLERRKFWVEEFRAATLEGVMTDWAAFHRSLEADEG